MAQMPGYLAYLNRGFVMHIFLIVGFVSLIAGAASAACTKPGYSGAFLKAIPTKGINQDLFSQALTLEASYVRCQKGRKALGDAAQFVKVSAGHSVWMASKRKLDHKGARGFRGRMRSGGVQFKTAAENIAAVERFQFPSGQFKIRNASACKFASQSGQAIPVHSYASLAQTVIAGWMGSNGHRKNLLNRRMKLAAGGLGFDASAPHCGRYYITQNYFG